MVDGVELFTLRQRRSPTGDIYFTGRLGNALVVMVRDDVESDLWKAIACDPSQSSHRDRGPSSARAISAPDVNGWYESNLDDSIPDDWTVPQQDSDGR